MNMKLLTAAAALLVVAGAATTAQARPHDSSYSGYSERASGERTAHSRKARHRSKARRHASRSRRGSYRHARRGRSGARVASHRGGVGARPGRWCGWYMRTRRGGGPEYNLAWNWRKYGSPSGPQVGAVVVWRHHVGEITGRTADGRWIVRSGNDGGRVRERPRSVAGAVFRVG
jgi:hypothetical protein